MRVRVYMGIAAALVAVAVAAFATGSAGAATGSTITGVATSIVGHVTYTPPGPSSLAHAEVGNWTGGRGYEPGGIDRLVINIHVGDTGDLNFAWTFLTTDSCTYDWTSVYVATAGGFVGVIGPCAYTQSGFYDLDLTPWANQDIRLFVDTRQDGFGDQTQFVIDNLSLSDTTPPAITVADVNARATAVATPVTYSASAVDSHDGPVAVTCLPASGSLFPLGTTTVSCTAVDAAGNAAARSFSVSLRNAAIDSAPSGETPVQEATVAFSLSIPRSQGWCSFNGAPEKKCGTSPLTFRGLAPGSYTYCVRGVAPGGVTEPPACGSWTFSPLRPVVTVTSATLTSPSDLQLFFTSDQPGPRVGSGFQCNLDNLGWTSCSSGVIYHGLAGTSASQQWHCIRVQATSIFGVQSNEFDFNSGAWATTPGTDTGIGCYSGGV